VRDRRLFIDNGASGPIAYRDSDFVLMSITGSAAREDENLLPFYGLKTEAINAISEGEEGEEGEKRGRANLIAAYQQIRKSPDVAYAEASRLLDKWMAEFNAERDRMCKIRAMPYKGREPVQDALADDLNNVVRRIGL
jgi:hypothetical protein